MDGGSDEVYQFKVVLVGDSRVGKTAFLKRFTESYFTTDMHPTIGVDLRMHDFKVEGKTVKLEIWDTAGQERFHTITRSYYNSAQGIIVLFDTTNFESFEHVPNWLDEIRHSCREEVCIIVVGNKSDLVDRREVSHENTQLLSRELGVTILEASAQSDWNVQKSFSLLTSAMIEVHESHGAGQTDRGVDLADSDRNVTQKKKCQC
mmetsp:Transcript_46539/g.68785  ORF Transcript_46539/g.68785 Transcript_46539/m.68785 type:complete len:205 (+) Transcript_46539:197-811(+)|eukprot:CAMPEP_0195517522 /NCGR_PEP_ID=MMETSP0794_2-20130614/10991_1 /TAXON_ID=515487 /ORGANISM="Stephanopyxis turris, Strain CCMP 815" /LENGTH=204 /DNA_ID=CAMNT_0040646341 /DNA_START=197 /DNA_END=811 /DNA_ORIENTATION=-